METIIRVTKLAAANDVFKFSIDSPKELMITTDTRNFIKLKGWVLGIDGTVPELVLDCGKATRFFAGVERLDVAKVHSGAPENCGFETFIEAGKDIKVGALYNGTVVWLASVSFEPVNVLVGHDGYLFLDHDSNKSVMQYSGELLIDAGNLDRWEQYFSKIEVEQSKNIFTAAFLIAPAKEYIFPEHYPVIRRGATPFDQFLSRFQYSAPIINPISQLLSSRNYSYSKIDTHWTHHGAHVAAELVCRHFGHKFVDADYDYKFVPTAGDLGVKLLPQISESLPYPDFSVLNGMRIFDNKIPNRGRVHIYANENSSSDKTCVVFGDSFSTTLIIHLIFSFRRLVHVFSGADIDWAIVNHEQPDFLLAEMTTRFLIKAPSAEFSLKSELTRKLSAFNSSQRRSAITNLARFTDPSIEYYKSISMAELNKSSV